MRVAKSTSKTITRYVKNWMKNSVIGESNIYTDKYSCNVHCGRINNMYFSEIILGLRWLADIYEHRYVVVSSVTGLITDGVS